MKYCLALDKVESLVALLRDKLGLKGRFCVGVNHFTPKGLHRQIKNYKLVGLSDKLKQAPIQQ